MYTIHIIVVWGHDVSQNKLISMDTGLLIDIRKAVDASPELRSKKTLIESFIAGINEVDDVLNKWHSFVVEQKKKELERIIAEERLKPEETQKYIDNAFRDGELKATGADIDQILPPISRFGKSYRSATKQNIIDRLREYFEKYFGVV